LSGEVADRKGPPRRAQNAGDRGIQALIDSLENAVTNTQWVPRSEWSSYYADQPSYDADAFASKIDLVSTWLERLRPATVWDLGANTGRFSKAAARYASLVVAFDADPACVETMYRDARGEKLDGLLPLVNDLTSPSPAIGWANEERQTLEERGPADLVLALALVHHLAVGNNVPLPAIASYFARLAKRVIIEFVPKSDPMVQAMTASRRDIFDTYTTEDFERAFAQHFTIDQRAMLSPSDRTLYLMTAR
jgi:ribosomal protein L11 methylase PrmA